MAGIDESELTPPEFVTREMEADKNDPNSVTLNTKDNSSVEQSRNFGRPQREKKLPSHLKDFILNSVQSENSTSITSSAAAILNNAATRNSVYSVSLDTKEAFSCTSRSCKIHQEMEITSETVKAVSPIPHTLPLLSSTSDCNQSRQDTPLDIFLDEGEILDSSYEAEMQALVDKATRSKLEPTTQQWLSNQTRSRLRKLIALKQAACPICNYACTTPRRQRIHLAQHFTRFFCQCGTNSTSRDVVARHQKRLQEMDKASEHGGETRLIYEVDPDSYSTWVEYVALEKPPTFETPRPYNEYSKVRQQPRGTSSKRKRSRSTSPNKRDINQSTPSKRQDDTKSTSPKKDIKQRLGPERITSRPIPSTIGRPIPAPRRLPSNTTVTVRSVQAYPDKVEISIPRRPMTTAGRLRLEAEQLRKTAAYLDGLADMEEAKNN